MLPDAKVRVLMMCDDSEFIDRSRKKFGPALFGQKLFEPTLLGRTIFGRPLILTLSLQRPNKVHPN